MQLYVGNLAYAVTGDDLNEAFSKFGEVTKASVIMDRETDRSKGFGFVEMPKSSEAEAAVKAMNGVDLKGRALKVNQAEPKKDGPRGGGGGDGGGRGGGGGGRDRDRGRY